MSKTRSNAIVSAKSHCALLECLERNYSSGLVDKCYDQGCELTNSRQAYLIFKGELLVSGKKICDCILFSLLHPLAILVELKNHTVHADEVEAKLQNGSHQVFTMLKKCLEHLQGWRIVPIVLANGWRGSEFRVLSKRRIEFQGIKNDIILKRCGEEVDNVLSSAGIHFS